jgi:hypothetical protein
MGAIVKIAKSLCSGGAPKQKTPGAFVSGGFCFARVACGTVSIPFYGIPLDDCVNLVFDIRDCLLFACRSPAQALEAFREPFNLPLAIAGDCEKSPVKENSVNLLWHRLLDLGSWWLVWHRLLGFGSWPLGRLCA